MPTAKRAAAALILITLAIPAYAGMAIQLDVQAPAWMYEKMTGLVEIGLILLTLAVAAFWPSSKGGDAG